MRVPLPSRYAVVITAVALAAAGFSAGFVWMTHMHHLLLPHVDPNRIAAYDASYESLTDHLGIPVNAVGAAGAAALLVFRHQLVPLWMPVVGLAMQAAVWVSRLWMWGDWAEVVRDQGVYLPDGTLNPAQLDYVNTHWIRIALISGYAVLVLATLITAVMRTPRRATLLPIPLGVCTCDAGMRSPPWHA